MSSAESRLRIPSNRPAGRLQKLPRLIRGSTTEKQFSQPGLGSSPTNTPTTGVSSGQPEDSISPAEITTTAHSSGTAARFRPRRPIRGSSSTPTSGPTIQAPEARRHGLHCQPGHRKCFIRWTIRKTETVPPTPSLSDTTNRDTGTCLRIKSQYPLDFRNSTRFKNARAQIGYWPCLAFFRGPLCPKSGFIWGEGCSQLN